MRPGDLVKFVGEGGAFTGAWAELLGPDNLVDDAWLPSDTPPGIYLGRAPSSWRSGPIDAEVLVNGQVYLVHPRTIKPIREE